MIAQLMAAFTCAVLIADGGATGAKSIIMPHEVEPVTVTSINADDDESADIIETETPMHLYGNCRITFYCHCATCNGRAGAPTASGAMPTVNHTVATGSLPFGTRLLIDGQEYTVEDRGVGDFEIDIFVGSHQEALDRGLYYTDVFVLN